MDSRIENTEKREFWPDSFHGSTVTSFVPIPNLAATIMAMDRATSSQSTQHGIPVCGNAATHSGTHIQSTISGVEKYSAVLGGSAIMGLPSESSPQNNSTDLEELLRSSHNAGTRFTSGCGNSAATASRAIGAPTNFTTATTSAASAYLIGAMSSSETSDGQTIETLYRTKVIQLEANLHTEREQVLALFESKRQEQMLALAEWKKKMELQQNQQQLRDSSLFAPPQSARIQPNKQPNLQRYQTSQLATKTKDSQLEQQNQVQLVQAQHLVQQQIVEQRRLIQQQQQQQHLLSMSQQQQHTHQHSHQQTGMQPQQPHAVRYPLHTIPQTLTPTVSSPTQMPVNQMLNLPPDNGAYSPQMWSSIVGSKSGM
jgi:hypothetical protein